MRARVRRPIRARVDPQSPRSPRDDVLPDLGRRPPTLRTRTGTRQTPRRGAAATPPLSSPSRALREVRRTSGEDVRGGGHALRGHHRRVGLSGAASTSDAARATGAKIVSHCGNDCVPWDLAVPLARHELARSRFGPGTTLSAASTFTELPLGVGASGATLATYLYRLGKKRGGSRTAFGRCSGYRTGPSRKGRRR